MTCNWLTAKEAAAKAKVTKASIWRWVRENKLPHSKTPGGTIRICEEDLIISTSEELPAFLRRSVDDVRD